ncbi:mas-related G-protein coupled receptor member H-like [Heteronotia binoei]|uniref:mas-related G-protein coupled receptor member H-like n=1 Tax=Heteronotia binoei TaxID=13085 RepID=UPI0029310717|nr:mas-related G-protein coupled receptor member H-like [Heteronotia binoei]
MDAALYYYDNPDYSYSSFPNDSLNYENISEDISSHNATDNGREASINDDVVTSILVISIFGVLGNGIVIRLLGFHTKRNPFSTYILNDTELGTHEYTLNNSTNIPDFIVTSHFSLITCILVFPICIAGIVGNGIVIWLLGFCMKRNPFTTYVLNLAIADTGVLITSILGYIVVTLILCAAFPLLGFYIYFWTWSFMYSTDQLLLTIISVDRCVAVLFPLWHRCHRPPHLSRLVCVSIWVLSFLIAVLDLFLAFVNDFILLQFILNVAICTPIMAISTIILFVKIRTQQRKQGRLLPVISLALFLFLLFGFPVNYGTIVLYLLDELEINSMFSDAFGYTKLNQVMIAWMVAFACAILSCSVNPLIYFLMGRKKTGQLRKSMKGILQSIFKDEENSRGQEGPHSETQF